MKAIIQYFDSENHIKLMKKKINNGIIKVSKDKYYSIDKVTPKWIQRPSWIFFKKVFPMYIIKWDSAVPADIEFKKNKERKKEYENRRKEIEEKQKDIEKESKEITKDQRSLGKKLKSGLTPELIESFSTRQNELGLKSKNLAIELANLDTEYNKLRAMEPEWDTASFKSAITPENFSKIMKQEALRELLTIGSVQRATIFMWLIMGILMGFMAMGLLYPHLFPAAPPTIIVQQTPPPISPG